MAEKYLEKQQLDYLIDRLDERYASGSGEQGQDGYSPIANVVKSNGVATITITDKIGTTTTTITDGVNGTNGTNGIDGQNGADGINGTNGADGQDGFSPIATVTKEGSVATITITDANGTTTATVSDGTSGSGSEYTLPTASTDILGGVKVDGTTITIADGVISSVSSGGGGSSSGEVYSSTETAIGTWVDGKTIYRKIFNISSSTGNIASDLLNFECNIDYMIDVRPILQNSTYRYTGNFCFPSNSVSSVSDVNNNIVYNSFACYADKGRVYFYRWKNFVGLYGYVIVEYTKL